MIPSRGPIQVTLDDTSTSRVQCKPPTSQVKILRRPKPAENAQVVDQASSINHNFNNRDGQRQDTFEDRLFSEPATFAERLKSQPRANITSGRSEIIKQAVPSLGHNQVDSPTSSSQSTQADGRAALDQRHQQSNAAGNNIKIDNRINKSIKTYQERADEYAKARLRILGSAFPENDESM